MRLPKMFNMTGKVAVITGSSKGMGLSAAQQLSALGAKVVVSSRTESDCQAAARDINTHWAQGTGQALPVACDFADITSFRRLLDVVISEWGRLDILVLNAGVSPFRGTMSELPPEALDQALDVNVKNVIWACNMACPHIAKRGGAVTIIGSIASARGTTLLGAYAISKAANAQIVRNLAVEWGPKNVRANCIAPGLIKTDFARRLWENKEIHDRTIRDYPLRRIGEPEDVAGMVVALSSDAGKFVTGQTIYVDGGWTVIGPN